MQKLFAVGVTAIIAMLGYLASPACAADKYKSTKDGAAVQLETTPTYPDRAQSLIVADDDDNTNQMILDAAKQIANSARCTANCNARLSSCTMRCRSYRNNDPQGVACVMDCNTDYNQCTANCQ